MQTNNDKVTNFLKDVRHEIDMLKQYATPEEKGRLNFRNFSHLSPQNCIYGQMTHHCASKRAKELMDLSCVRIMDVVGELSSLEYIDVEDESFMENVNGEYKQQTWGEQNEYCSLLNRDYQYISALEGYIIANNANNKEVLAYIKGETDSLEL